MQSGLEVYQISLNKTGMLTRILKQKELFIMLLPGLLFFLIFHYSPMLGLVIAFKDYNPVQGFLGSEWVGLKYFKQMFSYTEFWQVLRNTLIIGGYKIVIGSPISLILALMFNELRISILKRSLQSLIYLPHFFSWVILGGMLIQVLSPGSGIINEVLKASGLETIYFLADSFWFRPTLIASTIWKEMGWGTIIYLAALSGIDPQLYEASHIDGAGKWKQTIFITIPMLIPIFVIIMILRLGSVLGMDSFEQVLVLLTPVVYDVGNIIDNYVYKQGLLNGNFSYSAAVSVFKAVVAFILVYSTNLLSRKLTDSSLW